MSRKIPFLEMFAALSRRADLADAVQGWLIVSAAIDRASREAVITLEGAGGAEEELLGDPRLNLSIISGMGQVSVKPDILVDDNDEPEISGFKFRVLLTPGHTSGSCCYYFYEDKILISGDTLFYGSCGRTDFPTSSAAEMGRSLKRLVTELPEDVKVYPGHDSETSIGFEKRMNPFV